MFLAGVEVDSVHLSPGAIAEIMRDYHSTGRMQHHLAVDVDEKLFDFSIGAVREVWVDENQRRGRGQGGVNAHPLRASIPVAFNYRNGGVLADLGVNGTAEVNVAMLFELPMHRGEVPPHFKNHVRIDCSATKNDDITVFGPPEHEKIQIAEILAELIRTHYGGTFPVPPGMEQVVAQGESIEVIALPKPLNQLVIRTPQILKGGPREMDIMEKWGAAAKFSKSDKAIWAALISRDSLGLVLRRALDNIRHIIEAGAPADAAPEDTEVSLQDGFVQVTSLAATGGRKRSWEMGVRFELNRASELPLFRIRPVEHLAPAPPHLKHAICRSIEEAFGQYTLAIGRSLTIRSRKEQDNCIGSAIEARLSYPEISSTGLIFHGTLDRLEDTGVLVADFAYLRDPSGQTKFTFTAAQSWSPGSEVTKLTWNFGDGVEEMSSGRDLRLVTSHTFPNHGEYEVSLRVEDASGRVVYRRYRIAVGEWEIEVGAPVRAGSARYRTILRVRSGNTPVSEVRLQLKTPSGKHEIITNDDGEGVFEGRDVLLPMVHEWKQARPKVGSITINDWVGDERRDVIVVDAKAYDSVLEIIQLLDKALSRESLEEPDEYKRLWVAKTKKALLSGIIPSWARDIDKKNENVTAHIELTEVQINALKNRLEEGIGLVDF